MCEVRSCIPQPSSTFDLKNIVKNSENGLHCFLTNQFSECILTEHGYRDWIVQHMYTSINIVIMVNILCVGYFDN